jgi:O-antigen/teichoic acid export membrane protein
MVISFIAFAFVARKVGPGAIGHYFFWYWLATGISILANNGMAAAVSRFSAEYLGRQDSSAANQLAQLFNKYQWQCAFGSSLVLLLLSASRLISLSLEEAASIAGLAIALTVNNAQAGVAAAWQQYRLLAITRVVQMAVSAALMISVAVLAWDPVWLLLAQAIGLSAGALMFRSLWAVPTEVPTTKFNPELFRNIWRYVAFNFAIMLVGLFLWQRVEVLFLQILSTPSLVGLFGTATTLATALMRLPGALLGVLIPRFSELIGRGERQWVQTLATSSFRSSIFIGLPIAGCSAALAEPLLNLLYGHSFVAAGTTFSILICGQFLLLLCHVPRSLLFAAGHEPRILACDAGVCGVMLLLQPIGIHLFSLAGAAIGNVISMALLLGLSARILRLRESVDLPWNLFWTGLPAAAIGSVMVYLVFANTSSLLFTALALLISSFGYGLFSLYTGMVVPADLANVARFSPSLSRLLRRF